MAFPVTLNGRTYTLADFEGTNYVDGFPDALEDFVTQAGDIYNDTSSTSETIGTGAKTFTVSSGKPYQEGTPLRIADAASPDENFLDCVVTSYSGTALTVNAFGFAGSGTFSSWTINIGGAKTVDGTLAVNQGGTGSTSASGARTNLDVYSKSEANSRFLDVSGEASDVTMNGNVTIGDAPTDTLQVNATATFAEITYDNSVSGLSATTIKGAIDEIDGNLDSFVGDIISEGNSSVEVVDAGTGRIEFTVDGSEEARFTPTGLGINTTNPDSPVSIVGGTGTSSSLSFPHTDNSSITSKFSLVFQANRNGDISGRSIEFKNGGKGYSDGTTLGRFKSTGDFEFDSGFGSVATAYACRAWVNFKGNGTVSIRASGNVSSITDVSNGHYIVNLTNAMPDADYSVQCTADGAGDKLQADASNTNGRTTTSFNIFTYASGSESLDDFVGVMAAIFR